jgi:hypothetical protein
MNIVLALLKDSANLWSLHPLDRTVPLKVVTGVDLTTGIVTCPAHGYGPAGTVVKIRLKGFATPKVLNQIWRITVIDANTFSLSLWQPLTGQVVTGKNPTARLQTYTYVQIADVLQIRSTKHNVGRPTGQLGGRRKRRAS